MTANLTHYRKHEQQTLKHMTNKLCIHCGITQEYHAPDGRCFKFQHEKKPRYFTPIGCFPSGVMGQKAYEENPPNARLPELLQQNRELVEGLREVEVFLLVAINSRKKMKKGSPEFVNTKLALITIQELLKKYDNKKT